MGEVHASMLDVFAFMTARFKDDEEAAMELLGVGKEDPTEEEAEETANRLVSTLLGMTDFAISAVGVMALMVGCSHEKMMETMMMQMSIMAAHG